MQLLQLCPIFSRSLGASSFSSYQYWVLGHQISRQRNGVLRTQLLGDAGVRSLDVEISWNVSSFILRWISIAVFVLPSGAHCECQLSELSAGTSAWGRRASARWIRLQRAKIDKVRMVQSNR